MKINIENPREKQYDDLAREFQKADENFPDVTRPFIYSLIDHSKLPNSKLLDLGCGYGKDLEYFQEQGAEVYGVDISSEMITLSIGRVPKATLTRTSFDNLPYPDNFFDFVFSRYAIQHSHDIASAFKEVRRVLKKHTGELVFLVTHPIRHYFEKNTKDYWLQEEVSSVILDGEVTVEEPSHILSEYLSPYLLSNFTLEEFHEKEDPAARRFEGFGNYPRALVIKYRKK